MTNYHCSVASYRGRPITMADHPWPTVLLPWLAPSHGRPSVHLAGPLAFADHHCSPSLLPWPAICAPGLDFCLGWPRPWLAITARLSSCLGRPSAMANHPCPVGILLSPVIGYARLVSRLGQASCHDRPSFTLASHPSRHATAPPASLALLLWPAPCNDDHASQIFHGRTSDMPH